MHFDTTACPHNLSHQSTPLVDIKQAWFVNKQSSVRSHLVDSKANSNHWQRDDNHGSLGMNTIPFHGDRSEHTRNNGIAIGSAPRRGYMFELSRGRWFYTGCVSLDVIEFYLKKIKIPERDFHHQILSKVQLETF